MIENYSNLMYQNMANQRQQGAPPPPGKAPPGNQKDIFFMNSLQKTGEGLETQGAQIKVALDLPGARGTPHLPWLTSTTFNFPTNQNNNILQLCKSY